MRERPILFSSPMVQAILAGRKTITRRLVKPQPPETATNVQLAGDHIVYQQFGGHAGFEGGAVCRREPGDRLWVRETYYRSRNRWIYRADYHESERPSDIVEEWDDPPKARSEADKWKPSIFMPRSASRLTLEVTAVRVERLHDITDAEIAAEGTQYPVNSHGNALIRLTGKYPPCDYHRPIDLAAGETLTHAELLRAHFASLWDTLNGNWHDNPWVWVVSFKRIEVARA